MKTAYSIASQDGTVDRLILETLPILKQILIIVFKCAPGTWTPIERVTEKRLAVKVDEVQTQVLYHSAFRKEIIKDPTHTLYAPLSTNLEIIPDKTSIRRWLTPEELTKTLIYRRDTTFTVDNRETRQPWVTVQDVNNIKRQAGRDLTDSELQSFDDSPGWLTPDFQPSRVPTWTTTTEYLPDFYVSLMTAEEAIDHYGPDWRFKLKENYIFKPEYDVLLGINLGKLDTALLNQETLTIFDRYSNLVVEVPKTLQIKKFLL